MTWAMHHTCIVLLQVGRTPYTSSVCRWLLDFSFGLLMHGHLCVGFTAYVDLWSAAAIQHGIAVLPGVNDTDMVMAVISSPDCSSTMFGWASSCDWDPVTNRPALGSVVICPNFFNQTEEEQLATLLHEVTHALVRITHCIQV